MKLLWPRPNRTFGLVDAMGVTGATGFLVARFVPVARLPFWGCALRKATGWPCLGCGLTRVADRFSHGHLLGAWEANPLGTVFAALFALCILASVLHLTFAMPVPRLELTPREVKWGRVAFIAAVVVNYAFVVVKTRFPSWL